MPRHRARLFLRPPRHRLRAAGRALRRAASSRNCRGARIGARGALPSRSWLARLATQLGHALGDPSPIGEPRVEEATVELLAQIERRRAGRASPPPSWLRTARELLHDDPNASSLGALADRLDVHRVHLARAFRDHYGETVGTHLRRVRLLRAMRLLHQRDTPLSRVALDAGYADQSHMTRELRRHLDLTPVQARRTLLSFKTASGD